MISTTKNLSATNPVRLSSNLSNINYSYVERTFFNNFKVVEYDAFTNIVDCETKNHSKFYLSNKKNISDIIEDKTETIRAKDIYTPLKIGGGYIKFEIENNNNENDYKNDYSLDSVYANVGLDMHNSDRTRFFLEIIDNNSCRIYHVFQTKKYYLTLKDFFLRAENGEKILSEDGEPIVLDVDDNIPLVFMSEQVENDPIIFNYIYSELLNGLYLSLHQTGVTYRLKKDPTTIKMVKSQPNLKVGHISSPILINKDIYQKIGSADYSNFVKYDQSNNIDSYESDLTNNFLLHRTDNQLDTIYLKNQLLQNDVFSSANNLLSSQDINFYVNDLREYTSIFKDIDSETDEQLSMNFVFYNKPYVIKSGVNQFTSPSNMKPFIKININDTKFVHSGAFPFPTPQYADKIILMDDNITTKNGQRLLCTWLSGSPLSEDCGIWVDRYYYPDIISKEDALSSKNIFDTTYDDQIENMIRNNSNLSDKLPTVKFFDKRSDLTFKPNEVYEYHRLHFNINVGGNEIDSCNELVKSDINYFKVINESGRFVTRFYFDGDNTSWVFDSGKNRIDGGLRIKKDAENLAFTLKLYDTSTSLYTEFATTTVFNKLKSNFVGVSLDTLNGIGYFFLNQTIIKVFTFSKKQFFKKNILFNDFSVNGKNALLDNGILKNFKIDNIYIEPELMFLQPIIDKVMKIDDIFITLPCGMRNSSDDIQYLQSVCGNNAFKSNKYNIIIKNVDVDDDLKGGISEYVSVNTRTPTTSKVNKIEFKSFK